MCSASFLPNLAFPGHTEISHGNVLVWAAENEQVSPLQKERRFQHDPLGLYRVSLVDCLQAFMWMM